MSRRVRHSVGWRARIELLFALVLLSGFLMLAFPGSRSVANESLHSLRAAGANRSRAGEIAEGDNVACVVQPGGQLHCWGYKPVTGITNATEVVTSSAGEGACALLVTRHVECWGFNDFGQLGDGFPVGTRPETPRTVTLRCGYVALMTRRRLQRASAGPVLC